MFANVDYALTRYLKLSLGARYTDEERRFSGCSLEDHDHGGITGLAPILNARSLSEGGSGGAREGTCLTLDEDTRDPSIVKKTLEEDNISGKISLGWTPADGLLFYLSYNRGFKSGNFPIIPAAESEQFDPVTQERLDAIEVGGKTSWFNDALRIDFAAYDYDYKDKQLLSFFMDDIFGPLPKLFNVPESRVWGGELEVQSSPLPGLFVSAAASYINTEIRRFVGITRDGEENVDFSGNEMPFAPKRSFTLAANYNFPIWFISGLEGRIGFDYNYNSKATAAIEDDPVYDLVSYELLNARFGVGDAEGRWDAIVWVRNATDEFYQLNRPLNTADTRVRYTGMPRTYGLTLSYRYF